MADKIRVRFAPSPTGYLHVGGARTALFNWLFARHNGGDFVLRVEDTDTARNRDEFERGIFDGLRWLGLTWDEGPDIGGSFGPYRQSERQSLYREAADKLRASGHVYECFCIDTEPETQASESVTTDRTSADRTAASCPCRALEPAVRLERMAAGEPAALRMAVDPTLAITVVDLIRGDVTFPPGTVPDFIVIKRDGGALYNFAVVSDDHSMRITHVIRGEEHLANTPKQLLIYEALCWQPPAFAHIPIILNEQRRKLSKRDGATFVNDYETMGFLPQALVNFLALLGWSPGDNREILTIEEMIHDFTLAGVVKHPAIFDPAKLAWMNKEYMKQVAPADLARMVAVLLPVLRPNAVRKDAAHVARVTALLAERVHTIADIIEQGAYFFDADPPDPTPEALSKHCAAPETAERLAAVRDALAKADDFNTTGVEAAIRGLAEAKGTKAATYIHPLRVALTGQAVSPGIFEVASILGRDVALARIDALLNRLALASAPRS
jgi:nondiscriminating glutamyl-tRNA synthetase